MSEQWIATLRGQFQEIELRLGAAQGAERETVKRDIIALFKRVDGALGDLGQMKEDIRGLVERYKQGNATGAATAPQFTGARPRYRGNSEPWIFKAPSRGNFSKGAPIMERK